MIIAGALFRAFLSRRALRPGADTRARTHLGHLDRQRGGEVGRIEGGSGLDNLAANSPRLVGKSPDFDDNRELPLVVVTKCASSMEGDANLEMRLGGDRSA
jgi:hypothetical protein